MEILCLSKDDLINAGCNNIEKVMKIIEKELVEYKKGKIMNPDKISQIFDQETQNRINCMPATLIEEKVCGIKWVSVFPNNPIKYKILNVNAVIVLSNIINGLPIAFMDGTLITSLRTAGIGGIAAKYLAKKNSETIGFIGAGEQARKHLIAMKNAIPNIKKCKISDKNIEKETSFIDDMQHVFPDMSFELCKSDFEKAVKDADIVVTATSGQDQILKSEWIKEGAFYCHVGGLEDEFSVPKLANKIVCDDWEAVKHRKQTISVMYANGELKDSDIYGNIGDIVTNEKNGRENEKEFIYFNSVGLSYIDVAVANEMYKKCLEKGFGIKINI